MPTIPDMQGQPIAENPVGDLEPKPPVAAAAELDLDPTKQELEVMGPLEEPVQGPAPDPAQLSSQAQDDISTAYNEHKENVSDDEAIAQLEASVGNSSDNPPQVESGEPFDAGAAGKRAIDGAKKAGFGKKGSVTLDVMRGIGEAPSQMLGGARDAIQEMGDLSQEMSGIDIPDLPKVKDPTSTTGGLIRGISQFVTGWYAGGKVLKSVKAGGAVAKGVKAMAQGGIADFAAFDGHDKRLSDLIESFPALKNPVTEFLASDKNDTEIEGRLKNAVEGLGAGALTEGIIKAFTTGLKYIRAGREAKALGAGSEETAKALAAEAGHSANQQALSTLGDPAADLIYKTESKIQKGLDETAGVKPGDVTGAEPAKKEVFINWARIDSPEAVKETIQKMANEGKKGIEDSTRGVRTWEQTKMSAEKKDAWNVLMSRRAGAPLNAEESLATRQLWVSSAEKLKEVATIAAQSNNEANLFNFRKMLATHYAIQKEVIAARTETARALNAWKIPAGSGAEMTAQLQSIMESSGGIELAQEMAKKISLLSDAKMATGLETFVNGTAFARTRNAVSQYWMNALLSNPQTHVVNALSNFSVAFQQIYERKAAEYIGQKLGTQGGVEIGEAMAMTHGVLSTFKDSLIAFGKNIGEGNLLEKAKNFVTEDPTPFGSIKQETPRPGAMSAETWNVARQSTLGKALDVVDTATTVPGRLLQHSDGIFKSLGYRMELNAQATRLASQEMRGGVISPDAFKKRVKEIVDNPPEDIKIDSINAATYQTFQNKPAESLKKIGDGIQGIPVLGRLILPFKNTPINIMTYAFERTLLAPLVKTWRADIAAGGARADIALARMSTGTMILSLGIDMALSGTISGKGPQEPGQRANWDRLGNKPYSLKLGDTTYAYNRLDPLGFHLGMAADIAEAIVNAQDDLSDKDFEHVMVASVFSIGNNVMSKTYMQGVSELVQAIANSQQKASPYVSRLVGSAAPAGTSSLAKFGTPFGGGDPYMRVADGMIDAVRRRVPGLSKDLPLYRNLWGETTDYRSGHGWAADMFSPVYMKTTVAAPIDKELARLQYYPDMPKRKFEFNGVTLELDSKQYGRYVQLAGNEVKDPAFRMGAKDALNALVSGKHPKSAIYKMRSDGPDGFKAKMISSMMDKYRELAKKQLVAEDAGLRVQFQEKKEQKPGRLMPEFYGK